MVRHGWLAGLLVSGIWLAPMPLLASDVTDPLKDPLQLLEILEKRRKECEERTKQLDFREEELKRLEEKIEKRVGVLESLRMQIQTDMSKEQKVDDENINRLAKIYSGMKPKVAADQLKSMEQKIVLRILRAMGEKQAAKILNRMEPEAATPLTEALGLPLADKRRK
ncbi:MAG: hypothetical protein G8345_15605 [Magnetococcales bacterium]|nr:hypothetical protein [Magnetococcales bacterium]NGZ28304.1 hypothetical protein [Magnetococcales bacterium]